MVIVTLPSKRTIQDVVNSDTRWSIKIPSDEHLEVGDKITAIQQETGKYPSDTVSRIVLENDNYDWRRE